MEHADDPDPPRLPVLRARRRLSIGTLWLPRSALAEMRSEAREHAPLERGGMLLGWESDGQIVIRQLIGAGPCAKSTRSSFAADGSWQQRQLARAYADSERTVTYLGDWHSHPHGSRRPSSRDQDTATTIAESEEGRAPEPVTLILRRSPRRWRAHAYRHRDGRLQPLTVKLYADW